MFSLIKDFWKLWVLGGPGLVTSGVIGTLTVIRTIVLLLMSPFITGPGPSSMEGLHNTYARVSKNQGHLMFSTSSIAYLCKPKGLF